MLLQDRHGNKFSVREVYVRKMTFGVGIFRFALCCDGAASLQAVLDAQNSVMRLTNPKTAGRMTVIGGEPSLTGFQVDSAFEPQAFITNVLAQYVGQPGVDYFADQATDRLFVYTLAAVGGLTTELAVKKAAYDIGQMEWSATASVDAAYLDEFRAKQCYNRFAQPDGGLWMT